MAKCLLDNAKMLNISDETIIRKATIKVIPAINHNNVDVCQELVQVMPERVNLDLEHCGRLLSPVIGQSYKKRATIPEQTEIEYVILFLENGANPNVRTGREMLDE